MNGNIKKKKHSECLALLLSFKKYFDTNKKYTGALNWYLKFDISMSFYSFNAFSTR